MKVKELLNREKQENKDKNETKEIFLKNETEGIWILKDKELNENHKVIIRFL